MKNAIPEHIRRILKRLDNAGYEAYIVGGCVRDIVIGRMPTDWDITTSADCSEVQSIFDYTAPTGLKYGTVTVMCPEGDAQVTTFRSDGPYLEGRHPESVEFLKDLKKDLERRDFTINAMAMDINGNITDLFGGMKDIEQRVICCVGDPERRFREDALRMLRGLRFSAQLGFEIESKTLIAMRRCASLTSVLSGERLREEIEKILLSERPEILEKAADIGLLKHLFPCAGFADLKRIRELPEDNSARWTALCVSAGLGEIPAALRVDGKTAAKVRTAIRIVERPSEKNNGALYLLTVYGGEVLLCAAAAAYMCGDWRYDSFRRTAIECKPVKLAVVGTDIEEIGVPRGPEVGEMLDRLLSHVCGHPEENEKEHLKNLALKWAKGSER